MVDITFKCRKCKNNFSVKTTKAQNNQKEFWFVSGPDICYDCLNSDKMEERNKKIDSIIKKKWWQI